jgi:hypothetical protein
VSPSTLRLWLLAGFLVLLSACGEPPQALPTAPPYAPVSAASVEPPTVLPTTVPTVATLPALPPVTLPPPTYPTYPVPTTAAPPTTTSPTPTPSHAPRCLGEPTGAQILALIKNRAGVPRKPLKVDQGPFCAGDWSFTAVEIAGEDADQLEPLMVLATGKGATLTFVAAGSDVCSNRVQTTAPAGIRVLACGF